MKVLLYILIFILFLDYVVLNKEQRNTRNYGVEDMKEWDENIIKFYTNPDEKRTDTFITDFEYYTVGLFLFIRWIELGQEHMIKQALELRKSGGPRFLQTNINSTLLRAQANWDDYNTKLYERSREDAEDAWERLQKALKKAEFIENFDKMNS